MIIIKHYYKILITEYIYLKNDKNKKVEFLQTLYPDIRELYEKKERILDVLVGKENLLDYSVFEEGEEYIDEKDVDPIIDNIINKIGFYLHRCDLPEYLIIEANFIDDKKTILREIFTNTRIYLKDDANFINIEGNPIDELFDSTLKEMITLLKGFHLIKNGYKSELGMLRSREKVVPMKISLGD